MESLDHLLTKAPRGVDVPTNLTRSMEEKDPSEYIAKSNLWPSSTEIDVQPNVAKNSALDSVVQDDIKLTTKGDGAIRNVKINGKKVPRQLVEDAMFRNQDFMPRTDQFPLHTKKLEYDPTNEKQRSMFQKMTFPFAGLAMDVIRDEADTRVTITNTAGRYEE